MLEESIRDSRTRFMSLVQSWDLEIKDPSVLGRFCRPHTALNSRGNRYNIKVGKMTLLPREKRGVLVSFAYTMHTQYFACEFYNKAFKP